MGLVERVAVRTARAFGSPSIELYRGGPENRTAGPVPHRIEVRSYSVARRPTQSAGETGPREAHGARRRGHGYLSLAHVCVTASVCCVVTLVVAWRGSRGYAERRSR